MDYLTAMDEETRTSVKAALAELRRHDCIARVEGDSLIDTDSGETICPVIDGEVSTSSVLSFLGY